MAKFVVPRGNSEDGTCAYAPCEKAASTKGWCHAHYMQLYMGKELKPLTRRRRPVIDGKRWCTGCESWKAVEDYYVRQDGRNLSTVCKPCHIKQVQDRLARKEAQVAADAEKWRRLQEQINEWSKEATV